MSAPAPQIGFDRFIQLEWAESALRVRTGAMALPDFEETLRQSHAGLAARKKTRTVLNRLWLEPRPDLAAFADRAVAIYRESPESSAFPLTWGMALASYPFFGKVAEIVGRLTTLHGDCSAAEVHRRMAEIFGEREGTRRMTNMILQSQAEWGAILRTSRGRQIRRNTVTQLHQAQLPAWLAEACLRYAGRTLSIGGLEKNPVLFPFDLGESLAFVLSRSTSFEMAADSSGHQVVRLAA